MTDAQVSEFHGLATRMWSDADGLRFMGYSYAATAAKEMMTRGEDAEPSRSIIVRSAMYMASAVQAYKDFEDFCKWLKEHDRPIA